MEAKRAAAGLWSVWGAVLLGAGAAHLIAASTVAANEAGRTLFDARHGLMLSVGFMIVAVSLLYLRIGAWVWKDAARWGRWMNLVPGYMLVQFILFAVADDLLFLIGAAVEALIIIASLAAFRSSGSR